jgi:N-terminal domain of toast_rack, DUF2154
VRKLAGYTLAAAALLTWPGTVRAQDWRTITQMRQLTNANQPLRVNVQYGAGNLDISPGSDGLLYRASLRYDADAFRPQIDYDDGVLNLGVDDVRVRGRNVKAGEMKLQLGQRTPLDLHLEFGAARADLDLTGLRVRRFHLATGASETHLRFGEPNPETCELIELQIGAARFEALGLGNANARVLDFSGGVGDVTLDFTGESQQDLKARLKMGLGSLTLRVPRNVGMQVRKEGILVGFDSEGLIKRGDVYQSENWGSAARKLTVEIDAAFGSIRVVWIDAAQS